MDLELLKRFYLTAQEGTIGKAAERLYVAQSALTRSIQLFEHQMKTKLFERHPKGVQLTPQGERLYHFAKQIFDQTEIFEKSFHEKEDEISGEIKIVTTPFGGSEWLIPNLKGFLDRHQGITIKILLKNENIDPHEGDVIICPLIPHHPHLVQQYLYTAYTKLFASASYLRKFGTPQVIEDLKDHRLIAYKSNYYSPYGSTNWILNIGITEGQASRKAYFEVDSLNGMLNSALHGYGIAELPHLAIPLMEGLTEVLPEIAGPEVKMHYIFPEKRKNSKKINLLFKYLSARVSQWKGREALPKN